MPAAAVVVNARLAGDRFRRLCRAKAAQAGWEAEVLATTSGEPGDGLARAAVAAGAELVFAAGGDGTVRACARALAGTGIPLAIVPLGTGNLTARALGIPGRPGAALASGFSGKDRRVDLAVADGAPFTAMAGIGLDAAVVGAARLKHRLGWLAYAASGAAHLLAAPVTFTVRLDDGEPLTRRARSVVVGNCGLLPGGFALLPEARLDDGVLDAGVLAPGGPLGWPRIAARVLARSRHQDRHLERFRASRVEITAATPLPRQADGELLGPGRTLTVEVWPGALTVRVPAT
ncbi:MAG: NAD(+)/NADH kinase [Streptosporangiaceae bacterium]|nr:NAD(+)/NADH kinase [Streptosporangiaceae bacterium]MBV9856953.1 NAD(+)/NADH kinase [Streptosporangiaceae bacterium]